MLHCVVIGWTIFWLVILSWCIVHCCSIVTDRLIMYAGVYHTTVHRILCCDVACHIIGQNTKSSGGIMNRSRTRRWYCCLARQLVAGAKGWLICNGHVDICCNIKLLVYRYSLNQADTNQAFAGNGFPHAQSMFD